MEPWLSSPLPHSPPRTRARAPRPAGARLSANCRGRLSTAWPERGGGPQGSLKFSGRGRAGGEGGVVSSASSPQNPSAAHCHVSVASRGRRLI
eukprot:50821-Pyramimonas_sp.AAC.1